MVTRVLSLGAGVQSSTLLWMSLAGEIEPFDAVIFADTGWEPAAVYQHLANLKALTIASGIPFYEVSAGNIRNDALDPEKRFASMPAYILGPEGSKGMARRQCTTEYKLKPVLQKQRELAGLKPRQRSKEHLMDTIIGISWDETQRMRDAAYPWMRNVYPLIDLRMTRDDCLAWAQEHGYALPPRSACIGCPYKSNTEWRRLRDEAPDEWADAVAFDEAIRDGHGRTRGLMRGKVYLHAQRVPLAIVDLSTAEDRGQLGLFDDECLGMCGS